MADPAVTTTGTTTNDEVQLVIPPEVAEKFPELIELIKGSKSMNTEERQYWVDVLMIMSEDQIQNLYGILNNEKKQLAEAAQTFSSGAQAAEEKAKRVFDETAYLEKKRLRYSEEAQHEQAEAEDEAAILAELTKI